MGESAGGVKPEVVHLTDQLFNFGIIPVYLKVVDFIEETVELSQSRIKISENDVFLSEQ
jgi:hypothetical protein